MNNYKDFIQCIKDGSPNDLDYLAKENGNYKFSDVAANIASYNNDALREASKNGRLAIVDRLLGKKEDGTHEFPDVVNNITANDNEVLRFAARYGHLPIVDRLLGEKVDGTYEFPDVVDNIASYRNYALRLAAQNGHREIVGRLSRKKLDGTYKFPDVIDNITAAGNYALCSAARNGHKAIVDRLLGKKEDGTYEFQAVVDNITAWGSTALRGAAYNGYHEISRVVAQAAWSNISDMPQALKNDTKIMASIREGFRLDAVRIGNVYFLNKYAKDCAPHILSLAGLEYAHMVIPNRGDTDTGTNHTFKSFITKRIDAVKYVSEPMAGDLRDNEPSEGLPPFKKAKLS